MNSLLSVYRGCTPVTDAVYDPSTDASPAVAITYAIADAAGVDPTGVPSLYEYVDVDALNRLFSRAEGASTGGMILGFEVDIWNVFVHTDGRIRVCDSTKQIHPEPVFDTPLV